MAASFITETRAITPQNQTVRITDTRDDMFITEVGIGIDTSLVTILDPNMDIRSFLVFRELDVNFWEPLKNATLRLHTSNTLDFDADSSITIYGMALSDLQLEGPLSPATVLSLGFTSAHTDYNTSEFYGSQWHEINVTSIVEELIRNANWDGDGNAGTETGDAIGFHIVGAEGEDTRYFYDFKVGNGLEAQLVIHWNHEPPPPAGFEFAEFNETYRGYHVWTYDSTDMGWINYNDYDLFNVSGGEDFEIVSSVIISGYRISVASTDDFRLRRANPSNIGFVLMGINVTQVNDANVGEDNVAHFFGHATANKNVFNIDNDLNTGVFLGIATPDNQTDGIFAFAINTHNAGAWNIKYGDEYNVTRFPERQFYLNVSYNYPNQDFGVKVYDDIGFSNLLEDLNRTGYANIRAAGYGNEFAFNTESRGAHADYASWNIRSFEGERFVVADENGTVIDSDCETLDCALIVIDEVLGADPEDPDPPGQGWSETGPFTRFRTRLYILLMGFGLLFGPLFYFAMRRPSGYEFVIGLFIMFVGYAFLRAAAGI